MDRSPQRFAAVESSSGVLVVAVYYRLQVGLANPHECADEEGVDCYQFLDAVPSYLTHLKLRRKCSNR